MKRKRQTPSLAFHCTVEYWTTLLLADFQSVNTSFPGCKRWTPAITQVKWLLKFHSHFWIVKRLCLNRGHFLFSLSEDKSSSRVQDPLTLSTVAWRIRPPSSTNKFLISIGIQIQEANKKLFNESICLKELQLSHSLVYLSLNKDHRRRYQLQSIHECGKPLCK